MNKFLRRGTLALIALASVPAVSAADLTPGTYDQNATGVETVNFLETNVGWSGAYGGGVAYGNIADSVASNPGEGDGSAYKFTISGATGVSVYGSLVNHHGAAKLTIKNLTDGGDVVTDQIVDTGGQGAADQQLFWEQTGLDETKQYQIIFDDFHIGAGSQKYVVFDYIVVDGTVTLTPHGLNFDAAGERVQVADSEPLRLATTNFSIAAWIKPTDFSLARADIISNGKYNVAWDTWTVYLNKNKLGVRTSPNDDATTVGTVLEGTTSLIANKWAHVAVTFDNGTLTTYINGVQDAQTTGAVQPANRSSVVQIAGDDDGAGSRYEFSGTIDEISIWNKTLSTTEIAGIKAETFSDSAGNVHGSVTDTQIESLAWTDLIAYFHMNEGIGSAVNDISNNAATGSFIGSPTWVDSFDNFASIVTAPSGVDFDATDDFISLPSTDVLKLNINNFTVAAWIKPESSNIDDPISGNMEHRNDIISHGRGSTAWDSWTFMLKDGKVAFRNRLSGSPDTTEMVIAQTTVALSAWTHVAATFDNTANTLTLYVDGSSVDSITTTGTPFDNNSITQVGGDNDSVSGPRYLFDGIIDEVSIWNKTLTEVQVNLIAKEAFVKGASPTRAAEPVDGRVSGSQIDNLLWSDLVLYLPLDEGAQDTTQDLSDNSATATLSGAPLWIETTDDWAPVLTPATGLKVVQTGTELTWTVADEIGIKQYNVIDATTGEVLEVLIADESGSYETTVSAGVIAKLVVVDNSGFTQTFIPADGNVVKVAYDLNEGWNMIAMPGDNADISALETVISGGLWGWNGTAYETVEAPEVGNAVWVYAPATVQVIISAEKVETELTLNSGWNMVGPTENMEIPEAAHTVYGWNDTYQQIANENGVLIQGIGYWIFSL